MASALLKNTKKTTLAWKPDSGRGELPGEQQGVSPAGTVLVVSSVCP